jgi:Fic family protein
MATIQTITINDTTYDCSKAVTYHYGGFPPQRIDLNAVFEPLSAALQQLTRYDERLKHIPNPELLLAPLRQRDAVVSSRMEGTISTLEEVLRVEASEVAHRNDGVRRGDTVEVALYARALRQAEKQIADGYGLSEHLIRSAHQTLLSFGRGAEKTPGQYKQKQNYIGDRRLKRVDFIPISPEQLPAAMGELVSFLRGDKQHGLIKTSIAHAEFEALHPFEDGNGRLGRMLVPLMLSEQQLLSAPHFFVSDYFERNKDEYIERLRRVSQHGEWIEWCRFFLTALEAQATKNIEIVTAIQNLYAEMHGRSRQALRSQYFPAALDFIFSNPVFWNNHFVEAAAAPPSTLRNFTPRLVQDGVLTVIERPAGRAPGLYAFPSLLAILAAPD